MNENLPAIYLVGDVKLTNGASFNGAEGQYQVLSEIQAVMEKYQIVKIDLSMDPYLFLKVKTAISIN